MQSREAGPATDRWLRWLAPAVIVALAILAWDLVVRLNAIPPYTCPDQGWSPGA